MTNTPHEILIIIEASPSNIGQIYLYILGEVSAPPTRHPPGMVSRVLSRESHQVNRALTVGYTLHEIKRAHKHAYGQ